MKKLSKIKLHNAVLLENSEMKMIFGGSGGSNMSYCRDKGFAYICTCGNSVGEWCSHTDASGNTDYCASGTANCNRTS